MIGPAGAHEFSAEPLTGYKIAYPMISADGAMTAFSGVGAGRKHVYRASDEAVCLNNSRHPSPHRMCKCGFYCLHTFDAARDLTCAPDNQGTVVLEVAASGRYRRHEFGLRYERQRVRAVWLQRCRCGRGADRFVDSGTGRSGWRLLAPCCGVCAEGRPVLTPTRFAALSGEDGLRARVDRAPLKAFSVPARVSPRTRARSEDTAVFEAELAVVNARIDELNAQVEALLHRG